MSDTDRRSRRSPFASLAGLAAILLLAGGSWIVVRIASPAAVSLPPSCGAPVFLAHYSDDVQGASSALGHGFCGLEVDVQWREGLGLVVAHDRLPETWTAAGSLSLLGLLDSVPRLPSLIWLDFKNLSRHNAASAAAYVNALMAQHRLDGRVIVEARRPIALWLFHRKARTTIPAFWVPERRSGLRGVGYQTRLTLVVGALGLPALSVPKQLLTPQFAERFGRLALFTWTCNTPEEIRTATSRGARIILTDQPFPPPPAVASPPTTEVR